MPKHTVRLVHDDLTYNRSAIFADAWRIARSDARLFGGKLFRHQPFGFYLKQAWNLARKERALIVDGTVARERAAAAARAAALAKFIETLSPEILSPSGHAFIAHQCSTDGRLSA